MSNTNPPTVEPNFVFGSLSTDALRLKRMKKERSGLWHDQRINPIDPSPGDPIPITIGVGPDVTADRVTLYYTTDGSPPQGTQGKATVGTAIQMEQVAVEWDTLLWGYRNKWQGTIPPQPNGTQIQYIIEAWHNAHTISLYAGGESTPQIYGFFVDNEGVPDWIGESIIYQIFVDRFAPNPGTTFNTPSDRLAGFYGGTLQGIISKLDYLTDLGITCLWLTPIFSSPSHHGYDASDYSTVEPRLGTEKDMNQLLEEAHKRNIHLILDFVANHTSSLHPAFIAAQQSITDTHKDWFYFSHWPNKYEAFFNVKEMPKLNTDTPGAREYLIKNAQKWLKAGCDGFRLDHANGATHAFWSAFRAGTRAIKPDSVIFGEAVDTPRLQRSYTGRMDGTLDFLLHQTLRNFFSFNLMTVSQLDAFLHRHFDFFPKNFISPSFLDNHDMNRFLWTVKGDKCRLQLAALCQFTLPGPPIIYYGTEVGLSQQKNVGRLEESRLPMPWGNTQDKKLHRFYKNLIALRKKGGSIWRKTRQVLLINDEQGLYAYACGPYAIVLNNSPKTVKIPIKKWTGATLQLKTNPNITWQATTAILKLAPFSGGCLYLDA